MKDPNQKLVMTLLVRDEEDIVEECIKFHLSQGVDFIVATDNGSIDNTRNILLKYQKKGLLHLIDEPDHTYDQEVWVDRMIHIAKDQYKADWIINIDADEFWFSTLGNLKYALPSNKKCNVLRISCLQIDPVDSYHENGLFKIPKTVSGRIAPGFKRMHTAKGYKRNLIGNHEVKMKRLYRKTMVTSDIIIFHFQYRSYKQFEHKVIRGVKAFDNNPVLSKAQHIGKHLREYYKKYQAGELRKEYDNIITKNSKSPYYIKNDSRLYDYIENGYKSIDSILNKDLKLYNRRVK